ncbi:MAG: CPBP family intramembrane metalloprotease [bacterium]|nr:CPBP family intramembrane metalloprotease [bacterium]
MPEAWPPQEPEGGPPPPGQVYRLAWIFYLILAVVAVIWIGWSRGSIALDLVLDSRRWWLDVVLGVGAGLLLVGGWHAGRRFLPMMRELEELLRRHLGPLERSEVFALAVISGIAEELFFRGAMQSSWGWIWATLIFTLVHTGPGPAFRMWTVFALVAGLVFAGLTLYRGNILAAILAHFLVNWINLHALLVQAPAPETPEDPLG